jgi:hypothetical protein
MTAIVIACNEQTALTSLALNAIAKFTPEDHYLVLVQSPPSGRMFRAMMDFYAQHPVRWIITRPRVWPWWSSARKYAGAALADAASAGREAVGTSVDHVFFCHNDVVPLRAGWLSYLKGKLTPSYSAEYEAATYMVGVKASERNGAPHSSGVLFDTRWLATLPVSAFDARMPAWDVLEWPASMTRAWSARSLCHRPDAQTPQWMRRFWWARYSCDMSYDKDGEPFYVHRGGGSWLGTWDIDAWVRAAREGLGL